MAFRIISKSMLAFTKAELPLAVKHGLFLALAGRARLHLTLGKVLTKQFTIL